MKNAACYESFANQVQILLSKFEETFDDLSKKEALRYLEYALKFPVEHEAVEAKLSGIKDLERKQYVQDVITAKSNMTITFISEHGQELRELEAQKNKEGEKWYQVRYAFKRELIQIGVPVIDIITNIPTIIKELYYYGKKLDKK